MPRLGLSTLAVAFALAVPARAAAASPADVSAADALFREARAAARAGDHATACPKFRESYRLDPAIGTLLNVADCEEHDGHLVSALRRFDEAFHRLGPADDRVSYVRSRMHALDERVPRIVGTTGGLRVSVDGVAVVVTASAIAHPVDPGKHELHVEGPGRDERLVVVLKDGEKKEIDFAHPLVAPPAAVVAPVAPKPDAHPHASLGLVVGGIGLGALVASGISLGLMFNAKSTADARCQGTECDRTGIDATQAGKRFGTIAGATFALGAVGVGVGTYLVFSGGPRDEQKALSARREERSISVRPLLSPTGGGLVLGGTL